MDTDLPPLFTHLSVPYTVAPAVEMAWPHPRTDPHRNTKIWPSEHKSRQLQSSHEVSCRVTGLQWLLPLMPPATFFSYLFLWLKPRAQPLIIILQAVSQGFLPRNPTWTPSFKRKKKKKNLMIFHEGKNQKTLVLQKISWPFWWWHIILKSCFLQKLSL